MIQKYLIHFKGTLGVAIVPKIKTTGGSNPPWAYSPARSALQLSMSGETEIVDAVSVVLVYNK